MRMDAPVEHRYAPNLWAIVAESDLAQPFEHTGYVPARVDRHLEQAPIVDGFHPARRVAARNVQVHLLDGFTPTFAESDVKDTAGEIEVRSDGASAGQRFFATRGYAVITGDSRGTGASFGIWPYHRAPDETKDFGEIVDWIIEQPWSSSVVGGFGTSYTANTADWLSQNNHPAVKAIIPRFPNFDPYRPVAQGPPYPHRYRRC